MSGKTVCWVILGCITVLLLGVFFWQFHDSPLSDHVSDWGSFGDYIAICISLVSVVLIYQTYREQVESNKFIRFENTYWNLRKQLGYDSECHLGNLKKMIEGHFVTENYIDMNKFICLLNYYWGVHVHQYNMPFPFLDHLKNLSLFVISTNLLKKENKDIYLSLTYDCLKSDELFCFICYLSHYAYCHKSVSILRNEKVTNLFIKIGTELNILDSNQAQKNINLLEYHLDEDFCYNAAKHIKEKYIETLKRLKIE